MTHWRFYSRKWLVQVYFILIWTQSCKLQCLHILLLPTLTFDCQLQNKLLYYFLFSKMVFNHFSSLKSFILSKVAWLFKKWKDLTFHRSTWNKWIYFFYFTVPHICHETWKLEVLNSFNLFEILLFDKESIKLLSKFHNCNTLCINKTKLYHYEKYLLWPWKWGSDHFRARYHQTCPHQPIGFTTERSSVQRSDV